MKTKIKKRGIFVLFEGAESTIFESQVAIHVKDMLELGYEIKIIAFETRFSKWKRSLNNVNSLYKWS